MRAASTSANATLLYVVKPTDLKTLLATSSATSSGSGVAAVRTAIPTRHAAEAMIAPSITVRIPNRRMSGVVAGLIATLPTNSAITINPACAAVQPSPSWRNRASKNGIAVITARNAEPPAAVTR